MNFFGMHVQDTDRRKVTNPFFMKDMGLVDVDNNVEGERYITFTERNGGCSVPYFEIHTRDCWDMDE